MPTRTHSSGPFAPRGTLTREQLLAYAEGRLPPAGQHDVELHLEQDPLLREAVEGLRMPGASAALGELGATRPTPPTNATAWWAGGGALIAVLLALGWWSSRNGASEKPGTEVPQATLSTEGPAYMHEEAPLAPAEIAAAEERPAAERIGHEPRALHTSAMTLAVEREQGIERVDPRRSAMDLAAPGPDLRPVRPVRSSRQLLFLHDLKLVHPQELYKNDPVMRLADAHVAARHQDVRAQDSLRAENVMLAYTAFMDEALGRFARNDHKGCLDDLRFLLDQYPDDVNALFYGGLCAYNLGLHDRALRLLGRAATHKVDVFDEEAAWYHALTLERLGGTEAARAAFARIASQGGFYAEQAASRIGDDRGRINRY